jgi:hypothetical protein
VYDIQVQTLTLEFTLCLIPSTTRLMEKSPAVVWEGSFNEQLYQLITVFASANLPDQGERVSLDGPSIC